MADLQTAGEMRASIIAGFVAVPRWAGLYSMYARARDRRPCCWLCFGGVVEAMAADGELLVFPDPRFNYFDRYLWCGVQSTSRAAVARADLETIREGGTS